MEKGKKKREKSHLALRRANAVATTLVARREDRHRTVPHSTELGPHRRSQAAELTAGGPGLVLMLAPQGELVWGRPRRRSRLGSPCWP
jgi:hypothetical protein